jgi:hypothetical protein
LRTHARKAASLELRPPVVTVALDGDAVVGGVVGRGAAVVGGTVVDGAAVDVVVDVVVGAVVVTVVVGGTVDVVEVVGSAAVVGASVSVVAGLVVVGSVVVVVGPVVVDGSSAADADGRSAWRLPKTVTNASSPRATAMMELEWLRGVTSILSSGCGEPRFRRAPAGVAPTCLPS